MTGQACAIHLDRPACFTCGRCGSFVCSGCRTSDVPTWCDPCVQRVGSAARGGLKHGVLSASIRLGISNIRIYVGFAFIYLMLGCFEHFVVSPVHDVEPESLRHLFRLARATIILDGASGALSGWIGAMLIVLLARTAAHESPDLSHAFRRVWEARWTVAGVTLISSLPWMLLSPLINFSALVEDADTLYAASTVAILILLIAAIRLALRWLLAGPLVVLEDRGARAALTRSSELMRGRLLRALGLVTLLILPEMLLAAYRAVIELDGVMGAWRSAITTAELITLAVFSPFHVGLVVIFYLRTSRPDDADTRVHPGSLSEDLSA